MNRRSFLSFLGLGSTTDINIPNLDSDSEADGIIVIYLNVGQLPPFKAEAFIDRMKDKFRVEDKNKILEKWTTLFIPVRTQDTRVEFIRFNGNASSELVVGTPLKNEFVYPNKQKTTDYVLMMLGAPVINVGFDEGQIDFIYNTTVENFEKSQKDVGSIGVSLFKKMALAYGQIVFGNMKRNTDIVQEGETNLSNCLSLLFENTV